MGREPKNAPGFFFKLFKPVIGWVIRKDVERSIGTHLKGALEQAS